MKNQRAEKITLTVLAFMLALLAISGTYIDMSADTGITLAGFVRSNASLVFALLILLMIACCAMLHFIYKKVDRFNECKAADVPFQQVKTLLVYWMIIFAFWVPYLIICSPASSFGWDYSWQLLQGTGVVPLSNHHPVLGSLFYGVLYKIGFVIGGAYGGLFFTALFQVILMSFAMAYGLMTARRMGAPRKAAWCLLLFTCICPVFASHAVWLIKDSIYAPLIVILLSLCLNYRLGRDKLLYPVLIGIIGFLVIMYRSEGIIIVALLYLSLIVDALRNSHKKCLRRSLVSFASVLVLFVSFKIGICAAGIPSTSTTRESTTLLSAQIMECLQKHPADLSEKERAVLQKSYANLDDAILKYDEINRDPLKTEDMDPGDTMEYLKTWFQIGIRHKGEYIDTFLRGTNGYWWMFRNPNLIAHATPLYAPENDFANTKLRDTKVSDHKWLRRAYELYGIKTDKTIGELVLENNPDVEGIFYVRSSFPNARDSLKGFLDGLKRIPLLQFIFVPGFYFVICVISMGYLFIRRRAVFWQCLPIMLIVFIDCLSPVNGYMRYFLPVAMSSLLITGLCFKSVECENEQTANQ